MIHFLRPYCLLALLPLFSLVWYFFRTRQLGDGWRGVCDPHLLPHLLDAPTTSMRHHTALYWLGLGWLLAVLALSGPSVTQTAEAIYRTPFARVIVLDVSPSMQTRDLQPDRLTRAKYKLLDILKQSRDGQTGLVVFSGEAHVVSPLTHDAATIAAMVPAINFDIMPVPGAAMSMALKKAGQLFENAGVQHGNIVLMTDSPINANIQQVVTELKQRDITTSVFAIGTDQATPMFNTEGQLEENANGQPKTAHLDTAALQELAQLGGGRYTQFTSTNEDVDQLLAISPEQRSFSSGKQADEKAMIWKDQGRYVIGLLLIAALFAFRRMWMEQIL